MKKKNKFKKIVKWDNNYSHKPYKKRWTDKSVLIFGLCCMIPIFGQILLLLAFVRSLKTREVYYEECSQKMKTKKEAYEFIEKHCLQGIFDNAGSQDSMNAGEKLMKQAFKILGVRPR